VAMATVLTTPRRRWRNSASGMCWYLTLVDAAGANVRMDLGTEAYSSVASLTAGALSPTAASAPAAVEVGVVYEQGAEGCGGASCR
jgi:hypothetical protein